MMLYEHEMDIPGVLPRGFQFHTQIRYYFQHCRHMILLITATQEFRTKQPSVIEHIHADVQYWAYCPSALKKL